MPLSPNSTRSLRQAQRETLRLPSAINPTGGKYGGLSGWHSNVQIIKPTYIPTMCQSFMAIDWGSLKISRQPLANVNTAPHLMPRLDYRCAKMNSLQNPSMNLAKNLASVLSR